MFYPYRAPLYQNIYVLDSKFGDVNGDRVNDSVFLTGQKSSPDELFADNLTIVVQDGATNSHITIPLYNGAGYNAKLFLGYFSSKYKEDILVGADTGGSGGYILSYLYTINNNQPYLLFSSDRFNADSIYNAKFKDNYKVEVSHISGSLRFILDVSSKRKFYIKEGIYNRNGRLIAPADGGVLALGALFPLVNDYNGLYQLLAYQRIIGINNADNLGAVQTYLKWDGSRIVPDRVEVSIMPSRD